MLEIEKKQEYNYKILDLIRIEVEKYPYLRFGQILCNMNILKYDYDKDKGIPIMRDIYYDESIDIFNRITSNV